MKNTTKKIKTGATSVLTLRRQSLRALTTTELGQVAGGPLGGGGSRNTAPA